MSFELPILFKPWFGGSALATSRASGPISTPDGLLTLSSSMFPASLGINFTVRYASNPYAGYAYTEKGLSFPFNHAYSDATLSAAAPLRVALPAGSSYILPMANVISGSSGGYSIRGSVTSTSLLHNLNGDNYYHPVADPSADLVTFAVSDGPVTDGSYAYRGSGTAVTKCRLLFTGAVPLGYSYYTPQGGVIAYLDKLPRYDTLPSEWATFTGRATVTKHWHLCFTVEMWTEYSIVVEYSNSGGPWTPYPTRTGWRACTPVEVRYEKTSFASEDDFSPYGYCGLKETRPHASGTSIMFDADDTDLAEVVVV